MLAPDVLVIITQHAVLSVYLPVGHRRGCLKIKVVTFARLLLYLMIQHKIIMAGEDLPATRVT